MINSNEIASMAERAEAAIYKLPDNENSRIAIRHIIENVIRAALMSSGLKLNP